MKEHNVRVRAEEKVAIERSGKWYFSSVVVTLHLLSENEAIAHENAKCNKAAQISQ